MLTVFSFVALLTVGMGCDDDDDNGTDGTSRRGQNEVWMEGMAFIPETLTVASGTEVTWTNRDDVAHTVRSGSPAAPNDLLNSGNMTTGQTYSFTFTNADTIPDTHNYFCEIHPDVMRGVIIVE